MVGAVKDFVKKKRENNDSGRVHSSLKMLLLDNGAESVQLSFRVQRVVFKSHSELKELKLTLNSPSSSIHLVD